MALTNAYLVTTKNLESFLNSIKSAKAPERFTSTFLKNLDFSSSNDRLFIGVLKGLGFLDEAGVPTSKYFQFLDQGQSGKILADALRDAYADLFAINKRANEMTVDEVRNKLRTLTQGQKSDNVLSLMASTFRALSDLAEWDGTSPIPAAGIDEVPDVPEAATPPSAPTSHPESLPTKPFQLHYNIQIHLPESRDAAVFDAIFQALRKHLT
jgi:hypothetical protein